VGSTATASVGSTGAAVVAAATAAAGLVAVGGNRTMSRTWTMPLLAAMWHW
jgi:L-lactate utilization protein LutB